VWLSLLELSEAENHHVNLLHAPSQDLHFLNIFSNQGSKQTEYSENQPLMSVQTREQKAALCETVKSETKNISVTPENRISGRSYSATCPQCSGAISWQWDKKYWHGQCPSCTQKLRGKVNNSSPLEVRFLSEEHMFLSVRGC
jgi:hypothetical protein